MYFDLRSLLYSSLYADRKPKAANLAVMLMALPAQVSALLWPVSRADQTRKSIRTVAKQPVVHSAEPAVLQTFATRLRRPSY